MSNLRSDLRDRAHDLPAGDYDRCLHIAAAEQIDEIERQSHEAHRALKIAKLIIAKGVCNFSAEGGGPCGNCEQCMMVEEFMESRPMQWSLVKWCSV